MSETPTVTTDKVEAASIDDDDQDLRTLRKQFITVSNVDHLKSQQDIISILCCARGSGDKLVTRKKEMEATSWLLRDGQVGLSLVDKGL